MPLSTWTQQGGIILELVTTQADDQHYGQTHPLTPSTHTGTQFAASVTWPLWNISISCRGLSGYASHLGLLRSKKQTDEQTPRMTDRLMALNTDGFRGMKRVGWNQNTAMSIIRRVSEPCLPWNYNMVTESTWVFSFSLSAGITPLALLLYKSPVSLWREPIPPQVRALLEPIFVCSYRGTHTKPQRQEKFSKDPETGGLEEQPGATSDTHTRMQSHHSHYFSNFSFYSFQNDTFTVPVRKSLLKSAGVKDQCKKKKKIAKGKLNFSLCLSAHLSIRNLHHPSLILPPSLSLHHSLWWRIVIPLGSIFQASEHPFTAAITNL